MTVEITKKRSDLARRVAVSGSAILLCNLPDLAFEQVAAAHVLDGYWHWEVAHYRSYSEAIKRVAEREESQLEARGVDRVAVREAVVPPQD